MRFTNAVPETTSIKFETHFVTRDMTIRYDILNTLDLAEARGELFYASDYYETNVKRPVVKKLFQQKFGENKSPKTTAASHSGSFAPTKSFSLAAKEAIRKSVSGAGNSQHPVSRERCEETKLKRLSFTEIKQIQEQAMQVSDSDDEEEQRNGRVKNFNGEHIAVQVVRGANKTETRKRNLGILKLKVEMLESVISESFAQSGTFEATTEFK